MLRYVESTGAAHFVDISNIVEQLSRYVLGVAAISN